MTIEAVFSIQKYGAFVGIWRIGVGLIFRWGRKFVSFSPEYHVVRVGPLLLTEWIPPHVYYKEKPL